MIWQDPRTIAHALRDQACADLLAARFVLRSHLFEINGRRTSLAHVVVAKCQQACEKLLKAYLLYDDPQFDPVSGHTPLTDAAELSERTRQRLFRLFTILNRGNPQTVSELRWIESHAPQRPRPLIGDTPVPLAAMPPGVQFPQGLRDRVRYDPAGQNLIVSGRITGDERKDLLALSADLAYQKAVEDACTAAANKAGLPQPARIIPKNSEYPFWSERAQALVIPAEELQPRDHGIRAMKAAIGLFRTLSRSDPRAFTSPLDDFIHTYRMSADLDEFPEPPPSA